MHGSLPSLQSMSTTDLANHPPDPRTIIVYELLDRIRARIRRWLGIESHEQLLIGQQQLIVGQREDYDVLCQVIVRGDTEREAFQDTHGDQLSTAARQLNNITFAIDEMRDRLQHYERSIPQMLRAKRALDHARAKEHARRERYVKDHPELTEEERQSMLYTGKLPEPTPSEAPPLEAPPAGPMLTLMPPGDPETASTRSD